jgi:hypothetical protein
MKWMPFNALLEQGDHISNLLQGRMKKEMPILSEDQLQDLNYTLETAFVFKSEVCITYFENHDFKEVTGVLTRADSYTKDIFLGDIAINANKIIKIIIL